MQNANKIEDSQLDQQRAYVLFPAESGEVGSPRRPVIVGELLVALWKKKLIIMLATVFAALGAFAVTSFLPRVYEAKVVLIVSPSTFSTELRPPALPVDSYPNLVESPDIVNRLLQAARAQNLVGPEERLNAQLSTHLFLGTRRGQPHLPVIDLVVASSSAAYSAQLANLWAQISVEEIGQLTRRTGRDVVGFIEREYPVSKQRLTGFEAELRDAENSFDEQTQDLVDQRQAAVLEFTSKWNLPRMREEYATLKLLLTQPETGFLARSQALQVETEATKNARDQLAREIKAHPKIIVLAKGITDDALWERIQASASRNVNLENLRLRSETLNPVHSELALKLANATVKYNTLVAQEGHLRDETDKLRQQVEDANRLLKEREAELETLEGDFRVRLGSLRRERLFEVGRLQREVDSARKAHSVLSDKYESARLAKVEESADLKVAARAVPSDDPVAPRVAIITATAGLLGMFLAAGVVLVMSWP